MLAPGRASAHLGLRHPRKQHVADAQEFREDEGAPPESCNPGAPQQAREADCQQESRTRQTPGAGRAQRTPSEAGPATA
eukprot:13502016-Alexandrium_andersonii.AAC.1